MAYTTVLSRLSRLGRPADGEHNPRFTAQEVREILSPQYRSTGDRLDAVQEVAAIPGAWTGRLGKDRAWQLGRLAGRLPTLVYRYASGTPLDEIARGVGCLTTSTVERALDAACACIAAELNARRGRTAHALFGG
jgi:hypothetical protein